MENIRSDLPVRRVVAVDIGRGAAIIAMVVFHFTFDLEFLGLIPAGTTTQGGWAIFSRTIAGSFLFLTGVSLVLAHRNGIRWRSFLRRSGVIALAAVAVSVATYSVMPATFVYWGILHMIVAARFLGLGFLRMPAVVTAIVAVVVFFLPMHVQSGAFDTRWLAWLGFSEIRPRSVDFEPVFPWLAPCLLGIALAKAGEARGLFERLAMPREELSALSRAIGWAGRNSLAIYLLHQPVLLAVLTGLLRWMPST